jgi:hypothetical protein
MAPVLATPGPLEPNAERTDGERRPMSESLAQASPADLEALDRGVTETGLLAARAMARADALEARMAALEEALRRVAAATGIPLLPPPVPAGLTRGHLTLLPPA